MRAIDQQRAGVDPGGAGVGIRAVKDERATGGLRQGAATVEFAKWIADRNFCTLRFLSGIATRGGKFIIRQHGNMPYVLKGRRKRVGETETGVVYEQAMEITDDEGNIHVFRRITVCVSKIRAMKSAESAQPA